jgi:acetoin utilization deacetylase AcuC-like enzyme
MFYARVNKIKLLSNRKGFLELLNREKLRIYCRALNPTGISRMSDSYSYGGMIDHPPNMLKFTCNPIRKIEDLPDHDEKKCKVRLLDTVLLEAYRFAESSILEVEEVKDNQTLLFGNSGVMVYHNQFIPREMNIKVWAIKWEGDARKLVIDSDTVLKSDAFKGLLRAVKATMAAANPPAERE